MRLLLEESSPNAKEEIPRRDIISLALVLTAGVSPFMETQLIAWE